MVMEQDALDDIFGYYDCTCGHYAIEHSMDAPETMQQCFKCDCKDFTLAPKKVKE